MSHSLNDVTPLKWRPADLSDLEEVHALLTAIDTFDDTPPRWGDLPAWFAANGRLASELMVLGFERESLVAIGWLTLVEAPGAVQLDGAVHPAFRHQGIGRALFRWQLNRAREWFVSVGSEGPLRVVAFSSDTMTNKRSLFEHLGLEPTRWLIDMVCTFPVISRVEEYLVTPVLGIRFKPFGPEWVEPTRQAHNEAFASRWGSAEVDVEAWAASLAVENARPDLSWVAVDEQGIVVGYALNSAADEPGGAGLAWTDRLGVRPPHRGRNIARVLLSRSLDSFRRAGMDAGGVGLDSVDGGGTTLYRSLGYRPTDIIIQYERRETPAEARAALQAQ